MLTHYKCTPYKGLRIAYYGLLTIDTPATYNLQLTAYSLQSTTLQLTANLNLQPTADS